MRWSSAGRKKLAGRVVKLGPGFVGEFKWIALLAIVTSVAWGWMLTTGQRRRSPMAGPGPLAGGTDRTRMLLMSLWLPWIECSARAITRSASP